MAETKHTPGPWADHDEASFMGGASYRNIVASAGTHWKTICALPGYDDEEAQANARLIAASPTMFEALKAAERGYSNLVTYFSTDIDGPERDTLAQIRAALSSAVAKDGEPT